ncbi:isoprenylcysteine carboxylmethyltransferase family protein [Amylibacter sp. IMCC11727]|uniref:methyltransferase family protein n=1 Tax=Amylibacter sp. IMCC11727 TaxID=3039851 RepID=UPI00244DEC0A|nr:isoprenylcysteine carboxylmethyltransferase family protein [Amylibacter sp. IMCC11727]WGI20237.1 isoprenylcysteine carboxylmethyltransferase family protein [Amylibacter sp. IMCC11727]
MKHFPDLPPVWTIGAFVLSWVFSQVLPLVSVQSFGLQLLGLAWIGIAVLIVLWAALQFRKSKTTIEPHHTPTALIIKGPYRFSRNPIYVAMVLSSAGVALWCAALSAFIPTIVLAIVLHRRFVMPEERLLRETFGNDADAYISSSKRWV